MVDEIYYKPVVKLCKECSDFELDKDYPTRGYCNHLNAIVGTHCRGGTCRLNPKVKQIKL